jgi:enoyl-CoA hydratase/carnithine racemase|tara:strand:+ start:507 stop:1406 length:900 start_codon:yes stop_codon:yes gene_type:complete
MRKKPSVPLVFLERRLEMRPELVDYLLFEPEDSGICWIKFNRPEKMNALVGSSQMKGTVAKVVEYMRAADDDPDIRVIVLTGVGRGFCSGADLKAEAPPEVTGPEFPGTHTTGVGADATRQRFFHGFTALHRDISLIRKPTIAMINGAAVGSGMDMSLHCDIRIGCENTRFIAYHQAGQIIENGGSYYLPKMIGLGRALEFVYTGQMDAETAQEWGVLNHLVPAAELESYTRDLCDRIIAIPPLVQWNSKRIMRTALDSSLEATMTLTSNASPILQLSEDAGEARKAFREKRKPVFKGQ